ncbi:MAG: aldehyde dehydrogenase family protein [Acidobacteria bacterium]|nr:aldehyde dehydrogenase family protein [Acidobacteriota bacterium]
MSAAAQELQERHAARGLGSAEGLKMQWAQRSLAERLGVLRRARHGMAERAEAFAAAISPMLARTQADTLVSELLPLLDACKFLEREAEGLLAPRKLGRRGRPLWLAGVIAEVHREPLGHVLVIGPSNFPLFLPGVQVMQALAAGNTVTWKPGRGGGAVAQLVAQCCREAGLPVEALTVTDESVQAAEMALAASPDKVIFTGSADVGRGVLAKLAETETPAVVELSGADAIVVLPSADLGQVARAVAFGLRLNGGAVCMSPRRLFATTECMERLRPLLDAALAKIGPVKLEPTTAARLRVMVGAATGSGAIVRGAFRPEAQQPLVVDYATAEMAITRSDVFAPVISLLEVGTMEQVRGMYERCAYALTASIFCGRSDEREARTMASTLKAGTILINDAIAPTADPRLPFGGRAGSGYGVTRGAEGLLEMTAVKTLIVRRGGSMRHLDGTSELDTAMFVGLIEGLHGRGFAKRWAGLRRVLQRARR